MIALEADCDELKVYIINLKIPKIAQRGRTVSKQTKEIKWNHKKIVKRA